MPTICFRGYVKENHPPRVRTQQMFHEKFSLNIYSRDPKGMPTSFKTQSCRLYNSWVECGSTVTHRNELEWDTCSVILPLVKISSPPLCIFRIVSTEDILNFNKSYLYPVIFVEAVTWFPEHLVLFVDTFLEVKHKQILP